MEYLKYEELTNDEREKLLKEMLKMLRDGESSKRRLSNKLGVTELTVKILRKMLVDNRKYNGRRN